MANTRREPTAFLRSEDLHYESQAPGRIPLSRFALDLCTAPSSSCQEDGHDGHPRLLIHMPLISKIGDSIDIALLSHRETGGATVSVYDGNLVGRKLFALSLFPDRTVELRDPPTWQQLFAFALKNADIVLRKGCGIGMWYDLRRGLHVLDVVVCIANLGAALELGKCFDQRSIYDLERRREIVIPYGSSVSALSRVEGSDD